MRGARSSTSSGSSRAVSCASSSRPSSRRIPRSTCLARAPAHPRRRRGGAGLVLIAAGAGVALAAAAAATVALSSRGADVAVAPDSVAVIDPESGRVVADVPVGARPETLAADGRFLWVADIADGTVQQIDMRQAPRRGDDLAGTSASKRSPSARARPGSPTAGAAGPCAWTPSLGAVADSVSLPTTTKTGIQSGTRGAAALDRGALWVASTPLAAVLRVDTAEQAGESNASMSATTRPGWRSARARSGSPTAPTTP